MEVIHGFLIAVTIKLFCTLQHIAQFIAKRGGQCIHHVNLLAGKLLDLAAQHVLCMRQVSGLLAIAEELDTNPFADGTLDHVA